MIETILFYGVFTALLSFLLDYCLGRPSGNFSPYEIFSRYTLFLAESRMKKIGLWSDFYKQRQEAGALTSSLAELDETITSFDKMMVQRASDFFTWERAVGMCPVCTNVWINVIFMVVNIFTLHLGLLPLLYILLVSNFLIRLIIRL